MRSSRRQFLLSGLPLLAAAPGARPNLIFILVDDLRWDDLGCSGHHFARTPNIDRIANEGAVFRNAFVTTPLCSPSRASFLTGLYVHSHGIIDNIDRSAQSHQLPTFPRVLQSAGYETAFVGKWHMGNDDTPRPGFDYWFSFKGQGRYLNPEVNENGQRSTVQGYVTDIFSDRAVDFVRRNRSKPFLLYLAHKAVHPDSAQNLGGPFPPPPGGVFVPAPRHKTLYAGLSIPRRPSYGRPPEGKPALLRKIGDLPALGPDTVTDDETILNRLRKLAAVDEGLGRMFQALDETGQLENTVLAFAGDNGYFYGEHGLNHERRLAYEETARMPFFMRCPRLIRPGTKIDHFALNIDVAPTLLALAGAKAPRRMHGRSLAPLLGGNRKSWRTSFLIEYFSDRVYPRIFTMGYQAVRTEGWKYIHYKELSGMDELYDLKVDPYEMKNLIEEPAAQKELQRLRVELRRLLKETGAT